MHAKNCKIIILFFLGDKILLSILVSGYSILEFQSSNENKFKGLSKDYYFTYTLLGLDVRM